MDIKRQKDDNETRQGSDSSFSMGRIQMLLLKILNSKHVNEEKKNVEPETTGS